MYVCLSNRSFLYENFTSYEKGKKRRKQKNSDEEKEEKEAEGRKELINTSKSIKPFVSTVIAGFK